MIVDRTTGGIGVVVNPRAVCGARAALCDEALRRLRARWPITTVATVGDGRDHDRIVGLIETAKPTIVVAAGGDGTVHAVVRGLHAAGAPSRAQLGILPFGTGNNVARGLGLLTLPGRDAAPLERAIAALLEGVERCIDLGRVGPNIFVGSFAAGMDGAILAARNRWRRRWQREQQSGGYALYLVSCAVNLARHRAVAGRLSADGTPWEGRLFNLLLTNTPLYAGEFRFDGRDHSADGRLDLQVFNGPLDYVRAFVAAWRRHVHQQRGMPVTPAPRLRRVERVVIESARPLPIQLDGEEYPAAARYEVAVLPQALRVCVPKT